MQFNRYFYQDKKEMGLDTANILRELETQDEMQPSSPEIQSGLRALEKALKQQEEFEQMHPKMEDGRRRREFDELCAHALEISELYGLDVCAKIDQGMVGHITLCTDILLLRREYSCGFLPLLSRLMAMCDEFLAAPIEENGEMLISLSFDVPLYTRA